MTIYGGPEIIKDDLVINLDAANPKSITDQDLDIEYLIVAGGGGGGGVIGGGGGAGGLLHGTTTATIANGNYAIVIGAGGAGGTGWNTSGQAGKVGGNSTAFGLTANGGGGGRHYGSATTSTVVNGGSGGGGANGGANGGTGVAGQGYNGGGGGTYNVGAGGGGAGGAGGNATHSSNNGGHGGIGKYFGDSFGTTVGHNGWFADGGGGGVRYNRTRGLGSNGAGDGGNHNNDTLSSGITNAVANTGSGGGGAGYSGSSNSRIGGNGGSGVVIVKYLGPQKASGGDTIFNHNGYTVHVFTSDGDFKVGGAWGDLTKQSFKTKLVNGPTLNRNIAKGVVYFNGTDQYMRPPTSHSYLASSTLSCFFKALSVNVNSSNSNFRRATIMGYRNNSGYSDATLGSLLLISVNNGSTYNLQASLITASQVYRSTLVSVNLNTWYYAALVRDMENGVMSIYVNGKLGNSVTFDAATYAQWTSAGSYIGANVLDIGKASAGSSHGWGNDYFNGYMGNFRLYGRALTGDQINRNFRALKGRYGL